MPIAVGTLRSRECQVIAAAVTLCIACASSEQCFGYIPGELLQDLDILQRSLDTAALLGAPRHVPNAVAIHS